MAHTDINAQDVDTLARFLRAYLAERIPDGDFSEGSVLGELVVDAVAPIVAMLQQQIQQVRARQSLLTLRDLPDDEDVRDAADAILANWFRTRDQGTFARGTVVVHLSERVDVLIPRNARFFRTRANVFFLDSNRDLFVSASDLRPTIDATGQVVDWTFTAPLVAARVGTEYNLPPGRFAQLDRFSPFVTYAESTTWYAGGADTQSTADFADRARTAVAQRSLVNARSNDATLLERFPEITRLLTVGYGDPEMTRDRLTSDVAGARLNVGGHQDLYVHLPVLETVERLRAGDPVLRPDNRVLVLTDPGADFVAAGVQPNDVLRVAGGLPEAPFDFVVTAVETSSLEIAARTPFSVATSEELSPAALSYSVGNNYPAFDNKFQVTASPTARTARTIAGRNRVTLEGRPVYAINRVELLDAPSAFDAYKDPATGAIRFDARVNAPVRSVPAPGSPLPYRVVVARPEEGQSALAVTQIEVGWEGANFDGATVDVAYDTLAAFGAVDGYVRDPQNRIACANALVRGLHPVYVSFTVPYALHIATSSFEEVAFFDQALAARAAEEFVNTYRGANVLDQSLLVTQLRAVFGQLASVYPFTIAYTLYAPDGTAYEYVTADRITVFPTADSGARLRDPAAVGLPAAGYHAALRHRLTDLGVSDRTLRFLASSGSVAFERRG